MLLLINAIVLFATLVLLVVEEIRYRRFSTSVRAKRTALLSLSHQLRSPMARLKKYHIFLQNGAFGKLTSAQKEAMKNADSSFADMARLLEQLLVETRIEEPSIVSHGKPVSVRQACKAAITAITPAAEHKSQSVNFEHSPDFFVSIDPLLLHSILDELLFNVIRNTPLKGVIGMSLQEVNTHSVAIFIRTNDVGISPKKKEGMPQKNLRGKKPKKMTPSDKTSVAMTQTLTEIVGGSVRQIASKEKNLTFVITLPKTRKKV